MNELQEIYKTLLLCAQCGDCQSVCPTYRATKHEGSVARGRLATLRYAANGEIPLDKELKDHIYECLMCKSCEANCSSKVPVTEMIQRTREIYAKKDKMPFMDKMIFNNFMQNPKVIIMGNRLLRMYKNTVLGSFIKKSGMINIMGPLAIADDFLPKITPTFRDKEKNLHPNPSKPKVKVGYFLGCVTNIMKSDQAVAAVNTLRDMGCQVEIPEVICCGLPAMSSGYIEIAKETAKKNIDMLLGSDYDYITSDCASCSSQLKHYEKIFDENDPYHEKASKIAAKILDYSEIVLKVNTNNNLTYAHKKVTYHYPCHLARGLNLSEEPEAVLKSIKGIDFVPLKEADTCCGAAGEYFMTHVDMSNAILSRKMENIKASGADLVVTSCPMCVMQLEHGAKIFNVPVKVKHLAEVVAEASQS
jgi:glycolate oxidase iron-sulfur subunit